MPKLFFSVYECVFMCQCAFMWQCVLYVTVFYAPILMCFCHYVISSICFYFFGFIFIWFIISYVNVVLVFCNIVLRWFGYVMLFMCGSVLILYFCGETFDVCMKMSIYSVIQWEWYFP